MTLIVPMRRLVSDHFPDPTAHEVNCFASDWLQGTRMAHGQSCPQP